MDLGKPPFFLRFCAFFTERRPFSPRVTRKDLTELVL